MLTSDGAVPGSMAEALRMIGAGLDYLNSPAGADAPATACGEVLTALGELRGKLAAAQATFLARFDAASGYEGDGYGSAGAWLTARTRISRRDARAAIRQMRTLNDHPRLADAMAAGDISESWAREIAGWTGQLPAAESDQADKILLDAAAAGADLEDLGFLATRAYEAWRAQHSDPDEDPDRGFKNRYLRLGTTLDGAGRLTGNLTPEAAEALKAVLESLGKRQGPEDDRTAGERFHDALQEGCELLIRAKMVPDRAGADTHVEVHIPLSQLLDLPGASELETAWIRARLGEHGYLIGKDAEAAACDALIIPVVTGHADMQVIDQIIELVFDLAADAILGALGSASVSDGDGDQVSTRAPHEAPSRQAVTALKAQVRAALAVKAREDRALVPGRAFATLPPQARDKIRERVARLAIDFVSGPDGIASALRGQFLPPPYNTVSLPLDIGYSDSIPEAIRRAVKLRDKHCAWPGCCRPAAACDVHHIVHKKNGGKTSVSSCVLLCQYHHDVCIHRQGWTFTLHPDGSTEARGPGGKVLSSHAPPVIPTG
jgi:Domain of unknown function (DUF222)